MQERKFSSAELTSVNEQTYGEKAVGINFNPSNNDAIYICKKRYADSIDEMNDLRINSNSQEQKRLCSVAITELQSAQMWSVKALTWKDDLIEKPKHKEVVWEHLKGSVKPNLEKPTINIDYFFKSIFSILSIRKSIIKGLYVIESDSFKISIKVVSEEKIFRVSNGETRKENEIHIEVSNSILVESSDDFLLHFFMWCWFQRFSNTDKTYNERYGLSDALSLKFINENVDDVDYEDLLISIVDFFFNKSSNITFEQVSRVENIKNLIEKYKKQ